MASSPSSLFDIEPLDRGDTCRRAIDACSLCRKRLAGDRDIFMYRGDTPFCSEECRYHQMVRDHVCARKKNVPFSKTAQPAVKGQHQRRRHEAPAAAEPALVQIAANVPVAI